MFQGVPSSVTQRRWVSVGPKLYSTMPVTLVMLEAIRDWFEETGQVVGMKPAGGIRTAKQSLHYLVMVKETLGTNDTSYTVIKGEINQVAIWIGTDDIGIRTGIVGSIILSITGIEIECRIVFGGTDGLDRAVQDIVDRIIHIPECVDGFY